MHKQQRGKWWFIAWATAVTLLLTLPTAVWMQTSIQLWLGEPDTSDFPTVRFTMRTAGPDGAPLSEEALTNLRLRENGVPIANYDLRYLPVGMDAIFVLDANATFDDVNESNGQTAVDTTRELLTRYATRFMNPSGADAVSLIVPNTANTNGRFLLTNEANPTQLQETIAAYNPTLPEQTPTQAMLEMALDHAQTAARNGRYQAIFLLTEAWDPNEQLDYESLIAQAQAAGIPIFVGIMGPVATLEEVNNANALSTPTDGIYTHLLTADRSDPIFLRWQQQGNQPQITYQSFLRNSGTYPLAVTVGQTTASTDLVLELAPPTVNIALDSPVIRRVGAAEDTPLTELQPTLQPIPVQVSWADGLPRALTAVTFRVNNVLQPQDRLPQPDADGRFLLNWAIQNNDVGAYELRVEVEDVLGYRTSSAPFIATIATDRPQPPTPTPSPTATPLPVNQVARLTALPQSTLLTALAATALLGLVLVMLRAIRRYRESVLLREARQQRRTAIERRQAAQAAATPPEEEVEPLQLTLLPLGSKPAAPFVMGGESITLGRDETAVQLVLADRSVSPLHARIRQRNGRYWLYDEGSQNGTLHNHTLLGLSPKQLADGDEIQVGQVRLRVQLAPYRDPEPAADPTLADTPAADDATVADTTSADTASADATAEPTKPAPEPEDPTDPPSPPDS